AGRILVSRADAVGAAGFASAAGNVCVHPLNRSLRSQPHGFDFVVPWLRAFATDGSHSPLDRRKTIVALRILKWRYGKLEPAGWETRGAGVPNRRPCGNG